MEEIEKKEFGDNSPRLGWWLRIYALWVAGNLIYALVALYTKMTVTRWVLILVFGGILYLLATKKRWAVPVIITIHVLFVIFFIGAYLYLLKLTWDIFLEDSMSFTILIVAISVNILWAVYFKKSERVKSIFTL